MRGGRGREEEEIGSQPLFASVAASPANLVLFNRSCLKKPQRTANCQFPHLCLLSQENSPGETKLLINLYFVHCLVTP